MKYLQFLLARQLAHHFGHPWASMPITFRDRMTSEAIRAFFKAEDSRPNLAPETKEGMLVGSSPEGKIRWEISEEQATIYFHRECRAFRHYQNIQEAIERCENLPYARMLLEAALPPAPPPQGSEPIFKATWALTIPAFPTFDLTMGGWVGNLAEHEFNEEDYEYIQGVMVAVQVAHDFGTWAAEALPFYNPRMDLSWHDGAVKWRGTTIGRWDQNEWVWLDKVPVELEEHLTECILPCLPREAHEHIHKIVDRYQEFKENSSWPIPAVRLT